MDLQNNIIGLKASATLAINELSQKLITEGKEVFKFGLGQSPFPVPDIIVKELQKNAHQKDYLNVSGLIGLREVVANIIRIKININIMLKVSLLALDRKN